MTGTALRPSESLSASATGCVSRAELTHMRNLLRFWTSRLRRGEAGDALKGLRRQRVADGTGQP